MSQADAEFAVVAAGLANATAAIAALTKKVQEQDEKIAKLEGDHRRLAGVVAADLADEARTEGRGEGNAQAIVARMNARRAGKIGGV